MALAARTPDCLDDDTAVSFVEGLLSDADVAKVEAHIDECASCRQHLVLMVRGDSGSAPAAEPDARLLSHGALLGRYQVQRIVGFGSMGVVYAAYDTQLRRDVAVKLVRAGGHEQRLVREAHALARLRHPNVVTVHDVGTSGDRVFIVMELVTGVTLTERLRDARRASEIVPLFVQAARGLEAAHAAGLVHRDFKPDNVLVGEDGRVCVTDFGLARGTDGETPDDPVEERGSALGTTVTRSGALVGTPVYMAPEQHAGHPADARSDQFAFCVALFEALHGRRPFVGKDLAELARNVTSGTITRAPAGAPARRVPRRIERIVMRGLAIDPAARHPSLGALADRLAAAQRSRAAIAIAAGGVIAAAGVTAMLAWPRHAVDPCLASAGLVDEVWSAARTPVVAQLSSQRPQEAVMIASSTRLVDDWTASWRLARRAACAADGPRRDARLGCLDHGLAELRAQVAVWRSADGEVADRAMTAAAALPRPDACDTHTAAPIDHGIGERVARIDAAERSGQPARAKAELPALLSLAELHGPASIAAALVAAGGLEHALGDLETARAHLSRAAREAARAADDTVLFDAMVAEASVVIDQGRPLDSLGKIDAADALALRAGLDRSETIARIRGRALTAAGKVPEAIAELERALAAATTRSQRDPNARADVAAILGALAAAHIQRYDYDQARELLTRGLAIEEAVYGDQHPTVADTIHDLATTESRLGKYDDAVKHLERARAVFVAAYGEHHVKPAMMDIAYANTLMQQNFDEDARTELQHVLGELEHLVPADHPLIANVEGSLGIVEGKLDHCDAAIPHEERSIAILERIGRTGPELYNMQVNLGTCLSDVGRFADAQRALEQGLAGLEATGVSELERCGPWMILADLEAKQHHRERAIELARKVLAVTAGNDRPDVKFIHKFAEQALARW